MRQAKSIRIGLSVLLVIISAGCSANGPGDNPVESNGEASTWQQPPPSQPAVDDFNSFVSFKMYAPGPPPYQDQLTYTYRQQNELPELVLGPDGLISLGFGFSTRQERTLISAYVTDAEDSVIHLASADCSAKDVGATTTSPGQQDWACTSNFSVPGDPGGTYFTVIESTQWNSSESSMFRNVREITVNAFGAEGELCGVIDGQSHCNSLPK